MCIRILVLSALLVLSSAGYGSAAASADTKTLSERADAQAESIADTEQYLASIDQALELASKGEYGRLKRGSEEKLQAARDRIAVLLKGHASARELRPDDRIAVFNAQEVIKSIIQNQDKDRMVCRREAPTGSRIPTTECLTVGEREDRGRAASEGTAKVLREVCVPGEANPCGR